MWPHVANLVRRALARGLTDFGTIEAKVFSGSMLLWIAWDGEKIIAAAVTQLTEENGRKVGTIVAHAGSMWAKFGHLRFGLEDHFIAEGCSVSRILGRPGWSRILKDYRTKALVLEKELSK
jgi:hypothetical protein